MSCRLNARWVLYESLLTPGGLTWLCSTRFWPLTHFYCTDISLYRHKIQPLISPRLVLSGSVGRKPCRFAECSELSLSFLLSSVWWGSDVPSLPSVWGLQRKLFPQVPSLIKVVYLKLVCVVSLRVSLHVVIAHRDSLRYNPAPFKNPDIFQSEYSTFGISRYYKSSMVANFHDTLLKWVRYDDLH